jgi:tetratricopeptide (TPR) repeat protein
MRCIHRSRQSRTGGGVPPRGNLGPDAEAMLCSYLLEVGSDPDAIKEGFERSSRLLEDRRASPALRASALNRRAFMLAVGGWPHLMEEAEWAARDALHFLPGNQDVLGTMGLVLVRLGRFDEAEPMINTVIEHNLRAIAIAEGTTPASRVRSLAANRCALALLYAQTNRSDAAVNELAHARASDSACPLLPELDLMLGPVGVLHSH